MTSNGFEVGDRVEWTSQSAGCTRTKVGEVVEVVPAGVAPGPMTKNPNPGTARNHESYIVRVKGRGTYWPRAKSLRLAPVSVAAPSSREGGDDGR